MKITNEPLRAWLMGQWHSGHCYDYPHVSGTVCILPYSLWNGYLHFTDVRIEKSLHLLYPVLWTKPTTFNFNFNFYEGDFFYTLSPLCVFPVWLFHLKWSSPISDCWNFTCSSIWSKVTSILNPSLILPTGSCLCLWVPTILPFPY